MGIKKGALITALCLGVLSTSVLNTESLSIFSVNVINMKNIISDCTENDLLFDINKDSKVNIFDLIKIKHDEKTVFEYTETMTTETTVSETTTSQTTISETTVTEELPQTTVPPIASQTEISTSTIVTESPQTTTLPTETSTTGDIYINPFADGDVCTLKNAGSGKMLNVHMGNDANDVNVYQWTADGSVEQTFRMNFLIENSCYLIRSMSSSNGTNRTLDIVKSDGVVVSGGNVDIYNSVDPIAQQWLFVEVAENTYKIVPKSNTSVALTAFGNGNGTAYGTEPTSEGNVFVADYTGSAYQHWIITKIAETTEPIVTTAPPQITEPEQTTSVTTEKVLPNSFYIDGVTPIVQRGLPTGCEATGLTILLRWYGFNVTKEAMALTYMPRMDFYYVNGKRIGADFITTFAGDPRSSAGYGCYIPCMMQTVRNYFNDIGCTNYTPKNLTGTTLDNLFYYVSENTPVAVITTNNLMTPTQGSSWYTEDGRYVTWQRGHHCMVIIGYDYSKNVVYVSESAYSSIRTYNMDTFRNVYNLKGKNAMIVTKD